MLLYLKFTQCKRQINHKNDLPLRLAEINNTLYERNGDMSNYLKIIIKGLYGLEVWWMIRHHFRVNYK